MRVSKRRGVMVLAAVCSLQLGAVAARAELAVVSAAPRGQLAGDEQQRIQLVFSRPMVPLGEVSDSPSPPQTVHPDW